MREQGTRLRSMSTARIALASTPIAAAIVHWWPPARGCSAQRSRRLRGDRCWPDILLEPATRTFIDLRNESNVNSPGDQQQGTIQAPS